MPTLVYHYPNCSACKKALAWLNSAAVQAERIDIVQQPPTAAALRVAWQRSGLPLKRFFNTAGQSYRAGRFADRLATMSDEEQLAALAADGKLIKRPLLIADNRVLVGFRPADWQTALLS